MTKEDIRALQRSLNKFFKSYLLGYAPLLVDGDKGKRTNSYIRQAKEFLGYGREQRTAAVTSEFVRRLRHVKGKDAAKYAPASMRKRGAARRRKQRIAWRKNQLRSYIKPGVGQYDGKPVAKCAIPILNWCRQHGWHGQLVSGYRTPEYSEGLCYNMCGRPSCPGLCAGRSTNHSGNSPERFALDVSDYETFRNVVARCPLKPRIFNDLPRDRVHFSPNGHALDPSILFGLAALAERLF